MARYRYPVARRDWRAKIRDAISHDALVFIACFAHHTEARQLSYQNEELLLAIDQVRRRRPDDPWLIPVASTTAIFRGV